MAIESINPATNELIQKYQPHTPTEVEEKIRRTHEAWRDWKNTTFKQRAIHLRKASEILRQQKSELALLMALEMGKPVKAGESEIEKCAVCCDYYAEHSETFLAEEYIKTDAVRSYVTFQPLGVILAIMPWNFPFWQVFRFLAPGLMAGNCSVLKHASNVSACALKIEGIIREAGFPSDVFQTLLVESKDVYRVIQNTYIKAVTLTGSTHAGVQVAKQAGSLLKKTVLELGGSDPYLVLNDADLELAARVCTESRLINSGQSCIAAKRFIVIKEVEDQFIELFREKMASKIMGNPLDEKTDVGPQARLDLRDELHEQVVKSIKLGAKCILGGELTNQKGSFYPPTILTNVVKGMPAFDEEVFGPVAAVISASDENEAIRLANDSSFGLGAAVFSKDIEKAERLAKHLNAGSCFINDNVKSDPRLPFGGINQSGYGRELGTYGIKEFVNIKTVYIK